MCSLKAAADFREPQQQIGRILSSRMVRRWKEHSTHANGRFCMNARRDLETLMLALHVAVNLGFAMSQSAKMRFCCFAENSCVTFFHGKGWIQTSHPALAVYVLDDTPDGSRSILTTHLVEIGFTKFGLDPCLWLQRSMIGSLQSFFVLAVDDSVGNDTRRH